MIDSLDLLCVGYDAEETAALSCVLESRSGAVHLTAIGSPGALREALHRELPDCVVARTVCDGFSEFEALQIVRASAVATPFVFCGAGMPVSFAVEAMRRGATDCVSGTPAGVADAVLRAVTSRETTTAEPQDAASCQEERFRALVENGSDVLTLLSTNAAILYISPAVRLLLGYGPDELQGTNLRDLIHEEDAHSLLSALRTEVASGRSTRHEFRVRHQDGRWLWVESVGGHLLGPTPVDGMIVSLRDLTERKLLQEQLAQSERLSGIGRLASTVAHEFNNVLMGIQPFCDVIRRYANGNEKILDATSMIANSVSRGRRITQDILRFTQPAAPTAQTIDAPRWLETSAGELREVLGSRHSLMLDLKPDAGRIHGDVIQMTQVIANVVLNARDAMPGGGSISVVAERVRGARVFAFGVLPEDRDYVHISVTDTGAGILKENLAHVFDPLFTTRRNGTGLGLAVAHQIVRKHSGFIFAESVPGSGATFHIFIPSLSDLAQKSQARASDRPLRVLLVEDDATVAEGIAALLELADHHVKVATDGASALSALEAGTFDAAVLDVNLPDMSGIDLFQRVRALQPRLPIVFSTAHYEPMTLASIVGSTDGVAFLMKPYDANRLLEELGRIVTPSAAERP